MIISDLSFVEVVAEANVEGGTYGYPPRVYNEIDTISINFNSLNTFKTVVVPPSNVYNNSAAAGAKGDAVALYGMPAFTYTKADSGAIAYQLGSSSSFSTSAAVVTTLPRH